MKASKLIDGWNDYFFKERPLDGICIFRIFFGILILGVFFQDALYYKDFWGPNAIQSLETSMQNYRFPILNIFQYFNPLTDNIVLFFVISLITSLVLFIAGFQTRIMTIISFILLVSFNQRTINMLSSADLLIRIILLLMIFAPIGNMYSLDAMLARKKGKPLKTMGASWVHRLMQIQIAVVYVSTVIAKSHGETWLDGSAVYYASRLEDFIRFPVPFFLDWMWSVKLMTWGTLVLELALGTVIFIDEFRKPLIYLGILFHLGIEYMMSIPTFEWLMIVCLTGMLKVDDYPKLIHEEFIPLWKNFKTRIKAIQK
jgi:hypothetical protein